MASKPLHVLHAGCTNWPDAVVELKHDIQCSLHVTRATHQHITRPSTTLYLDMWSGVTEACHLPALKEKPQAKEREGVFLNI